MREAALPLLLLVAACGRGPSRAELQDRIAELEDENDTLKQQLGEAHDRLDERRTKPGHAGKTRSAPPATATATGANKPAHAAYLERETRGTAHPRPLKQPKPAREAENAAAEALVAAADARRAMAQR